MIPTADTFPTDAAEASAAAPRARRVPWGAAAAVFGGWTLVGLFGVTQAWLGSLYGDRPALSAAAIAWNFESVWLWALFTPAMFWLAWRFPLEKGRWGRNLALHAAFALGFAVLDVAVDVLVGPLLGGIQGRSLVSRFLGKSFINVFSYASMVGIAHAVRYYREAAARRDRAAELERQLLQARLQALEMQIHPHFLFNTLHAVASLIRVKEDQAAIRMLVGLSDLLRLALRNRDAQEVPLREELEFVRRYLDVERIRFQDRLRTEVDVAPDAPLDALVPHLVLQPLVENAIRHGVEARAAAGSVRVEVSREDGMLTMRVGDDGPGPNGNAKRGIGLGNTRERLRHLYGDRHRFELSGGAGGGALATVTVPL
ncbi:MAG TPA: histidine kinase, partial [Longimicrobium sp.]|nr:histidine kinase [Longimicrobium sp.]